MVTGYGKDVCVHIQSTYTPRYSSGSDFVVTVTSGCHVCAADVDDIDVPPEKAGLLATMF